MILKHRRLLPGLLCTALLGAGPAAAQQDGARSDADTALLSQIIGLDYGKQRAVYDRLGFAPGDAFWNCLCASAGYGSSSTSQFYHPGTIGDYDKRYSCNQPGDPCVVSGFGCSRHPLPSDAGIWERCGARSVAAGGADPLAALIASAKDVAAGKGSAAAGTGLDVCAQARAEALSQPDAGPDRLLRDVAADKVIYVLSPDMIALLREEIEAIPIGEALLAAGDAGAWTSDFLARRPELLKPDQVDLRVDVSPDGLGGGFELGFGLDKQGRVEPQEIVLKMEAVDDGPNVELGIGIGLQDGDWTKPEWNGRVKVGFSMDGIELGPLALEGKYGISVDQNLSTEDFYDGEWQTQSEYRLVRWIEDGVARLDFYVGGAAGAGGKSANVGVETSWNLRDRYTAGVFDEMTTALDNLLENQKIWEDRRRAMIEEEARAWGIDTTCMGPGSMISAVNAAYEAKLRSDPDLPRPFAKLRKPASAP